jgi:hypothetical protein
MPGTPTAQLFLYSCLVTNKLHPLNFSRDACPDIQSVIAIACVWYSVRTSVTFLILFALIPLSPACFALILASFINLYSLISLRYPVPTDLHRGEVEWHTFAGIERSLGISREAVSTSSGNASKKSTYQNIHVLADIALGVGFDNLLDGCPRIELLRACHRV